MNSRKNIGKRASLRFCTAFLFTATALVAGCNSGGGGTPATSTSTPAAIVITQKNSPQAAGAAYQGAGVASSSSSFASSSSSFGASVLTSAVVTSGAKWPDLAQFAKQQFAILTSLNYGASPNLVSGAVLTVKNILCDTPPGGTAGSFSASFDDKDNSGTLTTGDTLSATFSNCALDASTINGGISLTSLTINGTPSLSLTPWNVSATFTVTKLHLIDSSGNYTVNGAFSYSGSTKDGVSIKFSLRVPLLTVQKATGPTLTLTNFNLTGTTNNNTTAYSEYGSGQVNDSALSGYVNFQIPLTTPFTGFGDQYPSFGSMTVTGANNSSVKLTAINSTSVQLQVVANGVTYSAVTVPWSKVDP